MFDKAKKDKILKAVNTCVQPHVANCQECPYWNNGNKQCEELRLEICEAVHMAVALTDMYNKNN